jgi:NAD(P)-dependent dehydrogenase (short-subunit alcohol dehydrogenase family)
MRIFIAGVNGMARKTVLITGATSGIGFAGAEALGRKGWRVLVHGRNAARLDPAIAELQSRVPEGQFEGVTGDLTSLASVADLVRQVRTKTASLDALWNNAGGMNTSFVTTVDGLESQMAVNFIAPFALTRLLFALLLAAPQGRIVTTSSMAHVFAPRRIEDWLVPGGKRYRPMAVYGQSKLATLLFTEEFARRIGQGSVTINAYHPGFVRSGFGSGGDPQKKGSFAFASFLALSPEKGADTGVWLVDDPEVQSLTGSYWLKRRQKKPSSAVAPETARLVWDKAETAIQKTLGTLPILERGQSGK